MTYYTSSFAMRQTRSVKRNQNTVTFSGNAGALGPISQTIILALILCLMGLLYLTQITKQTSYGYELNALETQISELESEQENLQVEAARLQAIERVEESKVATELTTPANVDFSNQ